MSRFRIEGFRAFSEYDGYGMLEKQRLAINQAIQDQNDDYILNVNKDEYIGHLVSEYSIPPLVIHKDELTVSTHEEMIPAEMHPSSYYVNRGSNYPKDVIVYHLPFSGQPELLKVRASTHSLSAPLITVENGFINFRIINFNLDAERIKQESNQVIQSLEAQNSYLTNDLASFNASIEQNAIQAFDARKNQLLNKNNLISSLGVPVRKSTGTSSTFAVPAKRTMAIASKPKPEVTEKGYAPEPTLDAIIYNQILKIIHDVGKQFERLPSTYVYRPDT